VRSALERVDVDQTFAHELARVGLSATNLGDVVAANWVMSWEIANDEAAPGPAAARSVAAAVRTRLEGDPVISGVSNRDKQLLAEQLAYQTVMAQLTASAARTNGNTVALASLRQRLIDKFHASKVDLTALRLTDQGFVSR
jgi:hypothetical protein